MNLSIDPSLCATIPQLKMGVIYYDNITVGESPQMLKGRLQLFQEYIYFELKDKQLIELRELNEWRAIVKKLGKDPNQSQYRTESLYRRIKNKKYLPTVNAAVDISHFFSLKYKIPIGIYDAAQINGNITVRTGLSDESYIDLNEITSNLEHILVTADQKGPFGSLFADSKRTEITSKTTRALQIIYLPPSLDVENATKLVDSLAKMFVHINGGEYRMTIVQCA